MSVTSKKEVVSVKIAVSTVGTFCFNFSTSISLLQLFSIDFNIETLIERPASRNGRTMTSDMDSLETL